MDDYVARGTVTVSEPVAKKPALSDDSVEVSFEIFGEEAARVSQGAVAKDSEPLSALQAVNLLKIIDENPSLRAVCGLILSLVCTARYESVALLDEVRQTLPASAAPVQPLSSVLEILVREGAIEESLEVDGVPYEGSLEDAFNDETLDEDSEVLIYETVTDTGRIVRGELDSKKRTMQLFSEKSHYVDAFIYTLKLCDAESGITTKSLEAGLDAQGFLYRDDRTNIPQVYPSMYANFLKDVGCIAWDHAWITTDLGREIIEIYQSA